MANQSTVIEVESRSDRGKNACRRIRAENPSSGSEVMTDVSSQPPGASRASIIASSRASSGGRASNQAQ